MGVCVGVCVCMNTTCCDFQTFDDSRVLAVTKSSSIKKKIVLLMFICHISTMTIMELLWNVLVSYQLPLLILACALLLF